MFHNYDAHIDKKEYPRPPLIEDNTKILESDCVLSLVTDVFGNEIGIQARYGSAFNLYFRLDGCVEGSSIREFVKNCSVNFQIIDYWHKIVLEEVFPAEDVFMEEDETICIKVNESMAQQLRKETYYMNLSLIWPDGKYELYNENNGFLSVR